MKKYVNYNFERGTLFMLVSAFFMGLMSVTVKFLSNVTVYQKVFSRNLIILIITLVIINMKKSDIKPRNLNLIVMRSILGVMSIAANYYALSKINLVNAVALNRTSPIFAIIFSSVFLAEKVKKKYYFISLLAVIGMIFILKPTYQVSGVAQLCAIGSAVLAGGSYTVLRELRKYDSAETIMLYLSIISLLVVTPFLIMGDYVHMSPYEAVWLLGLGVFSMLAQYFMTKAYLCGLTGEVSLYSYMHIVFSAVFGIMIFDEGLSIATIIGISLILISGIVNIIFE